MKAIILAAGKGTRMKSDLQKVLHPILGRTILGYAVDAARGAGCEDITVVVGADGDAIRDGLGAAGEGLHFAVQKEQLGTGDAVKAGVGRVTGGDEVLVLCGDMPLITGEFLREFVAFGRENGADAVVAAAFSPEKSDFGRVFDKRGDFVEIVEARDLTAAHSHTDWVNTGIYFFRGGALIDALGWLGNENSQGEYYLTDVPKIIRGGDGRVCVFHSRTDLENFAGINTQEQLADAARLMRARLNSAHMAAGVRMLDPATVYIDADAKIAGGAVIFPNTIIEGACEIAGGAIVGPNSHLRDTVVGAGAAVRNSVTNSAKIGAYTEVGPFAYLRPGAVIGEKCRVGNFVEVKNATLGDGTKMAHLSYIGDADVGSGVNYSCGAITANYDGEKKHRTKIGDNAFIGSNANLIAPITIGENGFVAAGSTLTDDLPPCALGIARERQCVKLNWASK